MSTIPVLTGMRPHLNIATLCERYILEADGGLTLFRVVDRFTIGGNTPQMPLATVSCNLVIGFRSGDFLGPIDLAITILSPSFAPVQNLSIPVNFEAPPEKLVLSMGPFNLTVTEAGLYWIVVKLVEEEYTRIPLRIVYQRQPTVVTGA